MPRITRRPLPTSELASPASITAAATPVTPSATQAGGSTSKKDAWKTEAWDFYDRIGELRFVCQWLSNSLSRAQLYAARVEPSGQPSTQPTDDPTASQIVNDIAGGPAGQTQLLGRLATFLTVPGEGWVAIIVRDTPTGPVEEWHVLSSHEITNRGTQIILNLSDGTDHEYNPDQDVLTRVHRPHPRNAREADSPVRASLPILSEIARMSQTIEGAAKSRLAGNGILLLPQEISMPVAEPPRADPDAPGLPPGEPATYEHTNVSAQDVMAELQQAMTTAISDPTSAASMVPLVLKAPSDSLGEIRHLRFESEVTETSLKIRESAIQRLSLSLDVPSEVLMGMGQSNHWSAWQVDESAVKTHIAPMMSLICDSLTEAIFRPLLESAGLDPDEHVIWFDLKGLTQRPNRSDDATAAFDRGAISPEALRRELGFDDEDALNQEMTEERQRSLAIQMVSRAPSLLPYLADTIGISIDKSAGLASDRPRAQSSASAVREEPERS